MCKYFSFYYDQSLSIKENKVFPFNKKIKKIKKTELIKEKIVIKKYNTDTCV